MKKISAISLIFVLILSLGVFSFIDKNTYLVSTEKYSGTPRCVSPT